MTTLITGATAGIGAAFTETLAQQGHDLVLVARSAERLESQADILQRQYRISALALPADLSTDEGCQLVMDRLAANPPIDLLINNAGFGLNHRFSTGSLADEERMLDVLVRATMRLSHAVLPGMIERGAGTIINVSSVAGWVPMGTYSAAKSWVTAFSEGLAIELRGTGVSVTAVCPGFTHTEFHERARLSETVVPDWAWLTARSVAETGLRDARNGRVISVPSTRYALAAGVARAVPRSVLRRAIALSPNPLRRS